MDKSYIYSSFIFGKFVVNMGKFLETVDGQIPNFVGIKYTSNDVPLGLEAIKAKRGKFAVFLGCDQVCIRFAVELSNFSFTEL